MLTLRLFLRLSGNAPADQRDVYGECRIIPRNYRKYLYHAYLAYMELTGIGTYSA